MADRLCLQGVLYVLCNDIAWQLLPLKLGFGSGQACWRRLERWQQAGVFDQLHRILLAEHARDISVVERNELLLKKPLGILNSALAGRSHLAGDSFTVADLNLASILAWGKIVRLDLSAWPDLKRWLDACLARPANARARALGK